jgi:hypothetical protein
MICSFARVFCYSSIIVFSVCFCLTDAIYYSCRLCNRAILSSPPAEPIVVSIDHDDESVEAQGLGQALGQGQGQGLGQGEWACAVCTYINDEVDALCCKVCGSATAAAAAATAAAASRGVSALSRVPANSVSAAQGAPRSAREVVDVDGAYTTHTRGLESNRRGVGMGGAEAGVHSYGSYANGGVESNLDIAGDGDGDGDGDDWGEDSVYTRSAGDDVSMIYVSDDDDDDVEDVSDIEDASYREGSYASHFNAFAGPFNSDIAVHSSYADDPDLVHIVSVADLRRAPGATAIDFSKFVFGDSSGRSQNLKYESRKESRLKKKPKKAKKAYGAPAYKKRRTK